uniref:Huntingtin interacting protein 1 n=1 Tax=Panagrolaimus sp. JU765 TaxID=591449 RepID=A0AC34QKF4_9BILA
MSRSALNSHDRESFIKSQISSCHKALNKAEAPLKQKHARVLIVGTHKEHSANVFWNTVSHIPLEKNPIVTWKFCHLLHKLIRDGHRNVPQDSYKYKNRIVQLGNFWQHLRTSGYGTANFSYCQALVKRLEFHNRYKSILGSFEVSKAQLETLSQDVNEAFELAVELLDMMDSLLELKTSVTSTMDSLRWSSLILQGQCLLAPLVLVILDTSKIYDMIVKLLHKLHSQLPADVLAGHRSRFNIAYRSLKKFYDDAGTLQYFQYLVSIPTLPTDPPNFLSAHMMDTYQTPHAFLHGEGQSEGGDSPHDGQSLAGDLLVDLDFSQTIPSTPTPPVKDQKDVRIEQLESEILMLQQAQQKLVNEAKSRIEAYESRLQDLNSDRNYWKERHNEVQEESQKFRQSLEANKQTSQNNQELEAKLAESEEKFQKLKNAYTTFRAEHLQALRDIGELTKKSKGSDEKVGHYEEEIRNLKQQILEAEQNKRLIEEKAKTSASSIDEMESQLASSQIEIENLNRKLEHAEESHQKLLLELKTSIAKTKADLFAILCSSILKVFDEASDDLHNATSINYPAHLISNYLIADIEFVEKLRPIIEQQEVTTDLCLQLPIFGHRIANTAVNAASAAYSASIEKYDDINEVCKSLIADAVYFVTDLKNQNYHNAEKNTLPSVLRRLHELSETIQKLPKLSGDVDAEKVGQELESEMDRVNQAIAEAIKMIEDLQKKSRASATGARLEVNDRILDACNDLIAAIRILVIRSRDVQEEIVQQGRGSASPREFYKRNHQWTEGLLSAAKAVGGAATYLVQCADGVVTNKGKFENLIIAAQEVGASVAQLYVSSRVKADKDSKKMAELGLASKGVNKCTATVVATVKSGQLNLAEDKLDFTNLSLHDAKRQEMESQVRTLELEAELEKERLRLAGLRKQHYHLASIVAANQQNGNE